MPFQVRLPAPSPTFSSSQSNKRKPRLQVVRKAHRKPLTLTPGFKKGRHCKAHVESVTIDYLTAGPFKSGKGPRQLGFYQTAQHLRHNYRKPARPPTGRKQLLHVPQGSYPRIVIHPHSISSRRRVHHNYLP